MAKLLPNTTIGDKRYLHVYLDFGNIPETRYYKLATIDRGNGILQINGILGGYSSTEGRGLVNVIFSLSSSPGIGGIVSGYLNSSDIIFYVPNDTSLPGEVWLKVKVRGLVNLELSAVGAVNIVYDGTYSPSPPSGGTIYYLSDVGLTGVFRTPYYPIDFTPAEYVGYTVSSGISVVNSAYFELGAILMFVSLSVLDLQIISLISSSSIDTGFMGEGYIYLSIPLEGALTRMGINNISGVYTNVGASLSVYQGTSSNSHDNEYAVTGISWSSGNVIISLYRNRYTSSDMANVPTGVVRLLLF
mgnify:CR=1 FL=1